MELNYIHPTRTCRLQKSGEVTYVTFLKLMAYSGEMLHGFSTRAGGVSEGYLGKMNLSFHRGDRSEAVMENHRRFAAALGYDAARLVFSDQVHETQIRRVTSGDCGKGITKESDIRETDGLVTDEPGVPIMTFFADCVPLFFYDPVRKVAGMAHSGWRGTVERIGRKMTVFMREEYGSEPEDLVCAIGPSICQSCYEVSSDVADRFFEVFGKKHGDELLYSKENGKYQLNLHKACELTLLEAGVLPEHLDVTDLCTCCNPELFFSHRASNGKRGNLAGVMMLL